MQTTTANHASDLLRQAAETLAAISDDAVGLALELSVANEGNTVSTAGAAALRGHLLRVAHRFRGDCQRCRATLARQISA